MQSGRRVTTERQEPDCDPELCHHGNVHRGPITAACCPFCECTADCAHPVLAL